MSGPAARVMHSTWDARYVGLMFLMWAVMMTAMMVPAATPTVLLYGLLVRSRPEPRRPVHWGYAFSGGHLLVWAAFSVGAASL